MAAKKKTAKKAVKKTAKKTVKKSATKTPAKKTSKKTAKKASSKKVTEKKMATKKTATKKTTTKKAAKKAPAKKTTIEKITKKSAAKTETKSAPKKTTKKSGTKKTTAKKNATAEPKSGVTVQIGGSKPSLAIAPGAMLFIDKTKKSVSTKSDADSVRKLTKKELRDIKTMLEEKRDKIFYAMRRELAAQKQRAGNKSYDEADMAADAYDEDLSFEITSNSEEELSQIETALDKIEDGTYGECEECGCQIGPSRLKILPFATACKVCRKQKELTTQRNDGAAAWSFVGGVDDRDDSEE